MPVGGPARDARSSVGRRVSEVYIPDYVYRRAARFEDLIERAAVRHGVDPRLLWAVCLRESTFREGLRSHAGAGGLMQFMPGTARRFKINPWVAEEAYDGAARYLRLLLDMFDGDATKAVAAYNAGEIAVRGWSEGFSFRNHKGRLMNAGRVKTADGLPPYEETRRYVRYVSAVWRSVDWSQRFSPRVLAAYRVSWRSAPAGGARRVTDFYAAASTRVVRPVTGVGVAKQAGGAPAASPRPRQLSRYYVDGLAVPTAAAPAGSAYAPAVAEGASARVGDVRQFVQGGPVSAAAPAGLPGDGAGVHRDPFSGETFVVAPAAVEKKRPSLSQVSIYLVGGEDE